MGTNRLSRVGRALAPWLAMAALYAPVKHHAGPILDEVGKTAYSVKQGVQWLSEDIPDRLKGLVGEQTRLNTLTSGLETLGVDPDTIGTFAGSYATTKSIENYLNSAITASAKTTMDLNEAIGESAPWIEPFVRYTSVFRNRTSSETADAYQDFIDELHAFNQVANEMPGELEDAIASNDPESAARLIHEYTTVTENVTSQGNRFHSTIDNTLATLQEELRTELGDERYEQLRRYNEHERDVWGSLAAVIGSAAIAGAGAFALRKPARFVGGAAGSTLAYLGKKIENRGEEFESEPEIKWS